MFSLKWSEREMIKQCGVFLSAFNSLQISLVLFINTSAFAE